MQLLDTYARVIKEIHEYFGYVEDWAVIPIDDRREMFWKQDGYNVRYAPDEDTLNSDGDYYEDEIYTQRHLPKWIYPGEDYTMICVDTHTDGNKFLAIFANSKEVK